MRDPQVKQLKQAEREKHTLEERRVIALEEIADALESLRADFKGLTTVLPTLLKK